MRKLLFPLNRILLIFFATILTTACHSLSNNELTHFDTALPDVSSDRVHVRLADIPQFYQALPIKDFHSALKDKNALKNTTLVSGNDEILVVEAGRIIRTENFTINNLVSIQSDSLDPLSLGLLKSQTPKIWQRQQQWSSEKEPMEVSSTFSYVGEESILIQNIAFDTLLFAEKVNIPKLNMQFSNQFWLDKHSHEIVKTQQLAAPGQEVITMTANIAQ